MMLCGFLSAVVRRRDVNAAGSGFRRPGRASGKRPATWCTLPATLGAIRRALHPARARSPRTMDEHGRGLFLVAQLSQRWGSRPVPDGKVVWAETDFAGTPGSSEVALLSGP